MRKLIIISFVFFNFTTISKADNWIYSIDDAKKLSLATNKLILVDFWATWCGPCKKMDRECWSKSDVKLLMNNFVSVKIDIDNNKDFAKKYGVSVIPNIFIMDGNGKVIYRETGYKGFAQIIKTLEKYAVNTKYLNNELIAYYKHQNFTTSFKLAKKYQEYCLYLKKDISYSFLNLSDNYFDESLKHLKKSKLKNKKAFIQKLTLHKIQKQLILNKNKKGLQMLKKIDFNQVHSINQSMFCLLSFVANKQLKNEEEAKLWVDKLDKINLQKANLLLGIHKPS